jgi:hypothetical protein
MGGGLMQLVLNGQMDEYITTNPCINYYKYVYKKHTNFALESYETPPINNANGGFYRSVKMTYKIERRADLLTNMYLSFRIPNIYSNNDLKFRWVENIGYNYLDRVEFLIDGNIIETLYSDWMNIWNELTNKDGIEYNKLLGNVTEITAPYNSQVTKYTLINNKLYNINYPVSTFESSIPSIKSREIQIPLNFWFTRNPSLALPLLKLANNEVTLDVYTNSGGVESLYKVWSDKINSYVSSSFYNELYNTNISIQNFIKEKNFDVQNKLHMTYVFLDTTERSKMLIETNNMDYIIDTVKLTNINIDTSSQSTVTCNINNANNHIKEIIWFFRRNDMISKYNNYNNYTGSYVYNEDMHIMNNAVIKWANDTSRADYNSEYYNNIQPYYYHTNIPRTGIYCYSFALFPEKINASGSYNNSKIKTSITFTTNDYKNNESFNKIQNATKAVLGENYNYNVIYEGKFFVKEINVLSIINGSAQLKFV